ncbi:sphingomyelin phosphodiesterase, partial [Pseudomonas sp. MWU12-2115]
MKIRKVLLGAALAWTAAAVAAPPEALRLSTWNAMLLPQALYPNYGQMRRVELMAAS